MNGNFYFTSIRVVIYNVSIHVLVYTSLYMQKLFCSLYMVYTVRNAAYFQGDLKVMVSPKMFLAKIFNTT